VLEGQHRDQENRAEEQADDGQRPACQRPLQAVARVREGKLWSPSQVGHDMNCETARLVPTTVTMKELHLAGILSSTTENATVSIGSTQSAG